MHRRLNQLKLAVVIPCYQVSEHIAKVVAGIPSGVGRIFLVNDASRDRTWDVLQQLSQNDERVRILQHTRNQGVGGATVTGFTAAVHGLGLAVDDSWRADIVVKMDGDGQMDPKLLPCLLQPILEGRALYAKGNRFRKAADFRTMPMLRRFGSIALTFLTRLSSGYWHVFDPQNGYLAIDGPTLAKLSLAELDKRYFFENSMLGHLCIENAPVIDVPMKAVYGDERSSLSIGRVLLSFPLKLLGLFLRRVFTKYFVYDVSPIALYLALGLPSFFLGSTYGAYHWYLSASVGKFAATGTVALSLLAVVVGLDLFLQAFNLDVLSSPRPTAHRFEVPIQQIEEWLSPSELICRQSEPV